MPRRSARTKSNASGGWIAGVVVAVVVGPGLMTELFRKHPVALTLVAFGVIVVFTGAVYVRIAKARRLAEYERNVTVTDGMTGTQFEHYVARLMRSSGFRRVRVSGGSGDMGCDVEGYAPDGRKVVVQCKRYRNSLKSPDVQRFAGTARDVHGADVALLVTTAQVTKPARDVAALCRITLVDRPLLAQWATTHTPPISSWLDRRWNRTPGTTVLAVARRIVPTRRPAPPSDATGLPTAEAGPRPSSSRPSTKDWWNDHTAP